MPTHRARPPRRSTAVISRAPRRASDRRACAGRTRYALSQVELTVDGSTPDPACRADVLIIRDVERGCRRVRQGTAVVTILQGVADPASADMAPSRTMRPVARRPRTGAGRRRSTACRAARPPSRTRSAPARIGVGTSSSARASGPPASLALDCRTGQRTACSAASGRAAARARAGRASPGPARRPAGSGARGLGSSSVTAPGQQRAQRGARARRRARAARRARGRARRT